MVVIRSSIRNCRPRWLLRYYGNVLPVPPMGIVPAVVTPFRDDEQIDYSAWQRILEYLIATGVNGILAIGGQGEFYSLSEEERIVALRFCRQTIGGAVPLY